MMEKKDGIPRNIIMCHIYHLYGLPHVSPAYIYKKTYIRGCRCVVLTTYEVFVTAGVPAPKVHRSTRVYCRVNISPLRPMERSYSLIASTTSKAVVPQTIGRKVRYYLLRRKKIGPQLNRLLIVSMQKSNQ